MRRNAVKVNRGYFPMFIGKWPVIREASPAIHFSPMMRCTTNVFPHNCAVVALVPRRPGGRKPRRPGKITWQDGLDWHGIVANLIVTAL
jgi:hypothetical protein